MWRWAICVGLCAVLSACAINPPPTELRTRDDQFSPYREIASGQLRSGTGDSRELMQLIGRIDRKTAVVSTMVQITHVYRASMRLVFETARNVRAEPLRLAQLGRTSDCSPKIGCIYTEVYTIDIPESELRQAPATGYQFKIFARIGGERLMTIPKSLTTDLLQKIDADRQQHPQQVAKR
jgi:hypothetical protein